MDVTNPVNSGNTILLASASAVAARFQVGQLLQALVIAGTSQGRVVLNLNGQQLNAATDLPLRAGQTIDVQVERARSPVVLKVLPQASGRSEVEQQALRAALPRQIPLPPLLANLQALANPADTAVRPDIPRALADAATRLLQSLPTPRQLATGDGLREAMRQSGTFFEAGLRQMAAGTGTADAAELDIKGQLLRLLAQLSRPPVPTARPPSMPAGTPDARPGTDAPATRAAPEQPAQRPGAGSRANPEVASGPEKSAALPPRADPNPPPLRGRPSLPQGTTPPTLTSGMSAGKVVLELRAQVEGAVNRLQLHQLNSLPADDGSRSLWALEIPVRRDDGTDVLSLRILRDGQGQEEPGSDAAWTVELGFDLDGLGPLSTRLTFRGGRVSAVMWAEDPATVLTIQSRLEELRERMESSGLEVARLGIYPGRPPEAPGGGPGSSRLLSITA